MLCGSQGSSVHVFLNPCSWWRWSCQISCVCSKLLSTRPRSTQSCALECMKGEQVVGCMNLLLPNNCRIAVTEFAGCRKDWQLFLPMQLCTYDLCCKSVNGFRAFFCHSGVLHYAFSETKHGHCEECLNWHASICLWFQCITLQVTLLRKVQWTTERY